MMKTMTAFVLTICAASVLAGQSVQNDPIEPGRLNSRIGPADPQRYKSIRDAKNWENPYLVIRADGVEVIAKGLPSGRRTVPAADLRRTLIELPETAWPYGRVVAEQDIGIRAADRSDQQPISNNRNLTLAILKTLQVTVEKWPSA
ncbi:MAG: hypothetical protein JO290_01405 [Sphingomonadaceae bacterium]|nr:hypothetical protein [Pseudolabrys sp.]MBV8970926.1 hypothetical protein [Sphingomonadaceae bacterium]